MTAPELASTPPPGPAAERDPRRGSVLFLIRSLHVGGAERQLATLAVGLQARGHRVVIATFYAGGELASELIASGVAILPLAKRGRWDLIGPAFRLVKAVRQHRPEVLHPYLPDANLAATVLRPFLPPLRLVWGARTSNVEFSAYDWLTGLTYRLAGYLSSGADVIVVNSRAGAAYHVDQGYPRSRLQIIPNGIDTNQFQPDAIGRDRLRREWGVAAGAPLVGLVGRLDPMKDHRTFLEAAALFAARQADVRFVAVGGGAGSYADMLVDHAARVGISDRLTWAGMRADMPAVYSALDLSTSTSVGEGFPNAVAEAMACGTPCVVTDAGDSAWIVGDLGEVVAARDPASLAEAWEHMLAKRPLWPSIERRARIVREFSVERLVTDTERLLWPARR